MSVGSLRAGDRHLDSPFEALTLAQAGQRRREQRGLLRVLPENRLCGIVRNIGREGQSHRVLTLQELQTAPVDMFCTVFIGNSSTKELSGALITPRGYHNV